MARGRCESYKSIDIREWKREGLLSAPGKFFSIEWTYDGKPSDSISVRMGERDADIGIIGSVTLGYRVGQGQPIERPVAAVEESIGQNRRRQDGLYGSPLRGAR